MTIPAGKYVVLDVETTFNGAWPNGDPSPFIASNKLVRIGIKTEGDVGYMLWLPSTARLWHWPYDSHNIVVGHNLAFDLHWLFRHNPAYQYTFGRHLRIWDTQLAQFILDGQTEPYPSLNGVAVKYGLPSKLTEVEDLWAAGVATDEIDPAILDRYLKQDLDITEKVYLKQLEKAVANNQLQLILDMMESLLATIDMTWNGLRVDRARLADVHERMIAAAATTKASLCATVAELFSIPDYLPTSAQQTALVLYGGELEVPTRIATGEVYKSGPRKGEVKTKAGVTVRYVAGFGFPVLMTTEKGAPATHETALRRLLVADSTVSAVARDFVELLLEFRDAQKQVSTYTTPLLAKSETTGIIHHRINHTVARTARLTSSDPNLQNVTNGIVKTVFVPHADDDLIVEHDFKQLEVVALAIRSRDKQLMRDLRDGFDIHIELFKDLTGRVPMSEERKTAKRINFGLIYGAGKRKLAITSGLPESECQRFMDTFYNRYPGVAAYYEAGAEEARTLSTYSGDRDKKGVPIRKYVQRTTTGRNYVYREYEFPEGSGRYNFSPTELKNRPIQGFATGDVVPIAVGLLYRAVYEADLKVRLVNTVHDSIVASVPSACYDAYLATANRVLKSIPRYMQRVFGVEFDLPLDVTASVGYNWGEQIDIKSLECKPAAEMAALLEEFESE